MILDGSVFFDLLVLVIYKAKDNKNIINYVKNMEKLYRESKNINTKDEETIELLLKIIHEILDSELDIENNKKEIETLIERYLLSVEEGTLSYRLLNKLLKNNFSEQTLESIENRIKNILSLNYINNHVKKIYYHLNRIEPFSDIITQSNVLSEVYNLIETLNNAIHGKEFSLTKRPKPVERIDLTDENSIKKAFKAYEELRVSQLVKLGLQGLNKFNGRRKGFMLGESVVFCALPYNFKTSMLLYILKWLAEYNEFPDIEKPLVLFITLENKAVLNMMWLYEKIFRILYGGIPTDKFTEQEVVQTVKAFFSRNKRVKFLIERYHANTFGYDEFVELIEYYKSKGYKPVVTIIDYLSLMKQNDRKPPHLALQELYNNFCNYCKTEDILLFTAHQLNRAAALLAANTTYPVKKFNESHLAGSMDIAREPDILIFQHIERNDSGIPFLTMKLHKNRYVQNVSEKNRFVAYELKEYGLDEDFNTEFKGVKDIYKVKLENNQNTSNDDFIGF